MSMPFCFAEAESTVTVDAGPQGTFSGDNFVCDNPDFTVFLLI